MEVRNVSILTVYYDLYKDAPNLEKSDVVIYKDEHFFEIINGKNLQAFLEDTKKEFDIKQIDFYP